jgi:hypothetical protein
LLEVGGRLRAGSIRSGAAAQLVTKAFEFVEHHDGLWFVDGGQWDRIEWSRRLGSALEADAANIQVFLEAV